MKLLRAVPIFMCILWLSCNKQPPDNETKHLEVSNQTLRIEINGSRDSFTIQSNVSWQITGSANWFSLSQTSGSNDATIYVTATQNNTSGNTRAERMTVTPVANTDVYPLGVTVKQSYEKLSTKWVKLYGGSENDTIFYMTKARDGGFVMAGSSTSNDGDLTSGYGSVDAWLIKLDSNGTKQWSRKYGGSGFEEAMSVAATNDGGYVMAGVTSSKDGDAAGNHGGYDYFVLRVDGNGNKQWSKAFGGSGDEKARSVITTADGGCIVAGETASTDGDLANLSKGAWLIKLDASGNKQWSKTYGGSDGEEIWSIITDADGGYTVAGVIKVTGKRNDAWIFKTDASGNQQWSKTFGGGLDDRAWSIAGTTDGGYVFSGGAYSKDGDLPGNYGNLDAWVMKLDGNGNRVWSKIFGGSGTDLGDNIRATSDGGFLLTSSTNSFDLDGTGNASQGAIDALVIKLSADGTKQWSKIYGGIHYDYTECVVTLPDGFAIAGVAASTDGIMQGNHGKCDGYLIKEKVVQ